MSELQNVGLSSVDPNPFRLLADYPYNERKLETLMRSIADVGLWEGVIGRQKRNRIEIAFGHHRIEAARRSKLKTVPVIVRDLSDEQMIQFMGRENLEDYNSDFLAMLETWDAAIRFLSAERRNSQPLDIARLLGWTRLSNKGSEQIDNTASACHAAHALIAGGHLSRNDLANMSVKSAREIVERAQSRIQMLEDMAAKTKRPRADVERDKKIVGGAARTVARGVREGEIPQAQIRHEIDWRSWEKAKKDKQSPLFAPFAKGVAESIHKMLVGDTVAEKLSAMEADLPHVSLEEDRQALRRIDFALAEHEHTTGRWRERLTPQGKKVVPFKLLKGRE